VLIVEVSKN